MLHYLKKLIAYGLYLLVFLLPLQTRWIIKPGVLNGGYWEYGTYSLYITDVLLIIILLFYIALLVKNGKFSIFNFQFSKIWYLIAGLELFIFISIFFAPDKALAIFGYVRFLMGIGLFWLITSASYDRIRLIYSFIAGACLTAGLGIWQFLTQSSFASKWLGMALHDPADPGTSVIETINGGRWLRAYGSLDHPNVLGGLLVIVILLTIGLIINIWKDKNGKSEIRNPFPAGLGNLKFGSGLSKLQISNYKTLLLLTAYCLLLTALFFTFSRSAGLALLAGSLVMLVVTIWQKHKERFKSLLIIFAVSAVLSVILFILFPNLVMTRLSGDTRLEVKSNVERLESYATALGLVKHHWLFGIGINNYTLAVQNEIYPDLPAWYYQPAHNAFLLVWAETGIFGIILFISLCLNVCILLLKSFKNNSLIIGLALIGALGIIMLFDHFFWSLHFGILLFWLVIGIINASSQNVDNIN